MACQLGNWDRREDDNHMLGETLIASRSVEAVSSWSGCICEYTGCVTRGQGRVSVLSEKS